MTVELRLFHQAQHMVKWKRYSSQEIRTPNLTSSNLPPRQDVPPRQYIYLRKVTSLRNHQNILIIIKLYKTTANNCSFLYRVQKEKQCKTNIFGEKSSLQTVSLHKNTLKDRTEGQFIFVFVSPEDGHCFSILSILRPR